MTLWYLARAAGFAALLTATATIVLGALASSRHATSDVQRDRRVLRQLAHRSAGVVTLALVGLHFVLLVTDRFVDLSLPGVLLPFTAGYRAVGVGLGTLAAYGLLVVAVTGALRGRLAPSVAASRAWRAVHGSAYVVWLLAMGHGLLSGTDTATWWAWPLYGSCGLAVLAAGWVRLGGADDHNRAPLPAARRQLISGGPR
jgi:sulfoxide reductase heme-binding subunit YedZ